MIKFVSDLSWVVQIGVRGSGLWCLTPLSAMFLLYHGDHFYCWRKPMYTDKTTEPALCLYHVSYSKFMTFILVPNGKWLTHGELKKTNPLLDAITHIAYLLNTPPP
jgi:hypothetical protein